MEPTAVRTFKPRPFRDDFSRVPRHWFARNALSSHLVNALNILFPEGERFFMRSVRNYESQIEDPELRAQIRAFYQQEARHAHAHERWFDSLRAQGFDFRRYLAITKHLLRRDAEAIDMPKMRLSITVALEHYTAVMAELVFDDPYFADMDETMRALLMWHAAEEIEHKAVAFDVLKKVDPGYALRMGGFAVATIGLAIMWAIGTYDFLKQDPEVDGKRLLRDARELMKHQIVGRKIFLNALLTYLPRDFHPLQKDDFEKVRAHLERFEASLAA